MGYPYLMDVWTEGRMPLAERAGNEQRSADRSAQESRDVERIGAGKKHLAKKPPPFDVMPAAKVGTLMYRKRDHNRWLTVDFADY